MAYMTQNNPFTAGANLGDRTLLLWMSGTGYVYGTYDLATNKVSVSSTIPYPYATSGLTEGMWVYTYICYSVKQLTMMGYLKSPAGSVSTTLTSIQ